MKRRHLEISLAVLTAYSLFSASLAAQPSASKGTGAPAVPAPKPEASPAPSAKAAPAAKAPAAKAPAAPVKVDAAVKAEAPAKAEAPVAVPTKAATPKPATEAPKVAATKPKSAGAKASATASAAPANGAVKTDAKAAEATPAATEESVEGEPAEVTESEAASDATAATAAADKTEGAAATSAAETPPVETPPVQEKPKGPEAPLYSFIRLYLSVASVWNKDPGYDFFSKDDVGQRIGLQADFDVLDLTDSVTLALEAGIAGESDDDGRTPIGLANEGSLSSTHLFGGVVGRVNVFSFLDLHARATGGASFTELEFVRTTSDLTEDVISPLVGVGAGFSLRTEPRRLDRERTRFNSVSFGARFEGGYVMSSKVELAFSDQQVDIPEQRVRVQGASLGALDRTGAYFDVAAFVNF